MSITLHIRSSSCGYSIFIMYPRCGYTKRVVVGTVIAFSVGIILNCFFFGIICEDMKILKTKDTTIYFKII